MLLLLLIYPVDSIIHVLNNWAQEVKINIIINIFTNNFFECYFHQSKSFIISEKFWWECLVEWKMMTMYIWGYNKLKS